jgi:hypothetical protein
MYLFKFSYIELIFHSVPTSTKKSLALVSTELKARNKSGTGIIGEALLISVKTSRIRRAQLQTKKTRIA